MKFVGPEALDNPLAGEYQRILDSAIRETDRVALEIMQRKELLIQEMCDAGALKKNSFEYIAAINKYNSMSRESGDWFRLAPVEILLISVG